jgi:hypothetical protein
MSRRPTPRTDALMRRLDRALKKEYGRHAALAAYLYPQRPRDGATRLSEWVGRRRTPNGEALLGILEWLDGLP